MSINVSLRGSCIILCLSVSMYTIVSIFGPFLILTRSPSWMLIMFTIVTCLLLCLPVSHVYHCVYQCPISTIVSISVPYLLLCLSVSHIYYCVYQCPMSTIVSYLCLLSTIVSIIVPCPLVCLLVYNVYYSVYQYPMSTIVSINIPCLPLSLSIPHVYYCVCWWFISLVYHVYYCFYQNITGVECISLSLT